MSILENIFSLKDQVAIITGGVGLLGQEFASVLVGAGAKPIIFDIREKSDCVGEFMKVDITAKDQVGRAVKKIYEKHGRLDVLVNNAALNPVPGADYATSQFSPYEDYPEELWRSELSVGLTGALFCTQAAVPYMKKQGSGSIINISSHYGIVAPDNRIYEPGKYKSLGYAVSKGAVPNFTRTWASYLAATGVRVNTLSLGGVFANQPEAFVKAYGERTLLGRMAKKEEYGGAILFLASAASSYMTGANLIIDGGWTAL